MLTSVNLEWENKLKQALERSTEEAAMRLQLEHEVGVVVVVVVAAAVVGGHVVGSSHTNSLPTVFLFRRRGAAFVCSYIHDGFSITARNILGRGQPNAPRNSAVLDPPRRGTRVGAVPSISRLTNTNREHLIVPLGVLRHRIIPPAEGNTDTVVGQHPSHHLTLHMSFLRFLALPLGN